MGLVYADFSHGAQHWNVGRIIWMLMFIGEVIFMYLWDVYMDWGFKPFTSKNFLLRDELLLSPRWLYYFALISNFFARFFWALTITPIEFTTNTTNRELLTFVIYKRNTN